MQRSSRFWGFMLYFTFFALLAVVSFYFGFRLGTETDLTVGDLLRFLRRLYQWFSSG